MLNVDCCHMDHTHNPLRNSVSHHLNFHIITRLRSIRVQFYIGLSSHTHCCYNSSEYNLQYHNEQI